MSGTSTGELTTEVSPAPDRPAPGRSALLKKQMPGLDILRGLAVLAVVFYHGLGWALPLGAGLSHGAQQIVSVVHFGWLGVNLFFVLSGFLITGILLDTRHRDNYFQSFYVRRVLRIFPLYIVVLALAWWQYHLPLGYVALSLLYLANLLWLVAEPGRNYAVFWSLAVEEQFYLVWPLLVKHVSRSALTVICVVLMVVSPILRALSVHRAPWLGDAYMTTWLISDNLAWGALLALYLRSPRSTPTGVRRLTLALGAFGFILLGILLRFHLLTRAEPLGAALQIEPVLALCTMLVLLALRFGDRPLVIRVSAPLRLFGYISYGLYLLHLLFFTYYDETAARLGRTPGVLTAGELFGRFLIVIVLGSAVCLLSRRYFEDRFLRLKEILVPYDKGEPPTGEQVISARAVSRASSRR